MNLGPELVIKPGLSELGSGESGQGMWAWQSAAVSTGPGGHVAGLSSLAQAPHLEGTRAPVLRLLGMEAGGRWEAPGVRAGRLPGHAPWRTPPALSAPLPAGTRMSGCGTSAPTRGSRAPTCPLMLRRSDPSGSWCGPIGARGLGWGLGWGPGWSLSALLTSVPAAGHVPHQGGQGGLRHCVGSCVRDPRPGLCQRRQLHAGQRRGETQRGLHQPE